MSEVFKVEPSEIGWAADFVYQTAAPQVATYINNYANPGNGWDGVMAGVKPAFEKLKTARHERLSKIGATTTNLSFNLNNIAGMYESKDRANAEAIYREQMKQHHTSTDFYMPYSIVPAEFRAGFIAYPIDLKEVPTEEADVARLVENRMEWLSDANGAIKTITDIDLLSKILQPVSGNWEEFRRIGLVHGKSGTALKNIGWNLTRVKTELDKSWDGKAAINFNTYITDLTKAMEYEHAIGQILEIALDQAATQYEKAVQSLVDKLYDKLKEEVEFNSVKKILKLAAKKLPIGGYIYQAWSIIDKLNKLAKESKRLKEEIEKAVDSLKEFIAFADNPSDYLKDKTKGKIEEKFKPLNKAKEFSELLGEIVQIDHYSNLPKDHFKIFGNPWEGAK